MPAIRDPIHSWIYCSKKEMELIDSPLFQRLNWISQLTLIKTLYPGGTHTRFIHSLGAMKLASDYMDNIFKTIEQYNLKTSSLPSKSYKKFLKQLARTSALLHDIGHGPYSHAYDRSVYSQIYGIPDKGHDQHRLIMVQHELLKPHIISLGLTPEQLMAVWDPQYCEDATEIEKDWYGIIRACVQGPIGADRMDFTMRDSYFTGTQHAGTIASDRIIHNCGVYEINGHLRLFYNVKCMNDIIQALDGRKWMYENVYLHKTSCSNYVLIEKMMACMTEELRLIDRTKNLEEFVWLNESTLIGDVLSKGNPKIPDRSDNMELAYECCQRILLRKYPKLVEEHKIFDDKDPVLELKEGQHVFKTRIITGVEPDKFDAYKIGFWIDQEDKKVFMTCNEVLQTKDYTVPQKPYSIVRVYQW